MWRDIALMNGPAIMEDDDFFSDYFGQLRTLSRTSMVTDCKSFCRIQEKQDAIL
jgi:hypothetical protein